MAEPITKTKIVVFVIIVVAFVSMSYFIAKAFASKCPSKMQYDNDQKKCIPICDRNGTYYPSVDKCLRCPPGQIFDKDLGCIADCSSFGDKYKPCGVNCFIDSEAICIDGRVCYNNQIDRKNPKKLSCCPENTFYNSTTGLCEQCSVSKNQIPCGNKCCDPDTDGKIKQCIGGICCSEKSIHGTQCCAKYSTVDGCCSDDDNIFVSDDGNYCIEKCVNGNVFCRPKNNEKCVDDITRWVNGVPTATSVCKSQSGCSVSTPIVDPSDIYDKPVCKAKTDVENLGPFAACKVSDITSYTKKETLSILSKKGTCSVGDCWDIVGKNKGLLDVKFDETTNTCTAVLDCQYADGTSNTCPPTGQLILPNHPTQNCVDSNNLVTHLCPENTECIYSPSGVPVCAKGFSVNKVYEGEYGCVPDNSTPKYTTLSDCLKNLPTESPPCPPGYVKKYVNNISRCVRPPPPSVVTGGNCDCSLTECDMNLWTTLTSRTPITYCDNEQMYAATPLDLDGNIRMWCKDPDSGNTPNTYICDGNKSYYKCTENSCADWVGSWEYHFPHTTCGIFDSWTTSASNNLGDFTNIDYPKECRTQFAAFSDKPTS